MVRQAREFVHFVDNKVTPTNVHDVLWDAFCGFRMQAHIFEHIGEMFRECKLKPKDAVSEIQGACLVFKHLLTENPAAARVPLLKFRREYEAAGKSEWMAYFTVTHRAIGGRLKARDNVSWYRAAQNGRATLRWDPDACMPGPKRTPPKPSRLTRSQQVILGELNGFWELLRENPNVAGVRVREKPLVVAPTGSGKSHCVKEFCRLKQVSLLELEPSAWVPVGARFDRYTSQDIQSFVRENDRGVIFLDECDKLVAQSDYMVGVRQEIYSLLDGASRGYATLSDQEKEKLRREFLIVGAGTWQSIFSTREMGFVDRRTGVSIEKQDLIPEEFLRRFGSILYLKPPEAEEFEEWLRDMYSELCLPTPDTHALARQAVASELNCRWMENHLAALLRDPEVKKLRTEQEITRVVGNLVGCRPNSDNEDVLF